VFVLSFLTHQTDDVGMKSSGSGKSNVSKFLNRLLGMNLNRQRLMTQYFMKSLENEVNNAKRAGKYDVGIQMMTGNNIEINETPRVFSFRGLDAKDDKVVVYKVENDRGTSPETAMDLYNDAKDNNAPTSRSEWNRRGQRHEVVTGFYVDKRNFCKVTPKVFLIINAGKLSGLSWSFSIQPYPLF